MGRQQQEADLAGDLVVDGETYGWVKSFCYLGDTLDGNGVLIRSNLTFYAVSL